MTRAERLRLALLLATLSGALGCRGARGPLPAGSALGGYQDVGDVESYTPLTLYAYMDGGADAFAEYGLSSAWVRHYRRGSSELTVELYEMKDEEAAGGLFSYMRRPDTEGEVAPGCQGSLTGSDVRLAKGRHVLVCRNDDPMAEQVDLVRDLCARVAGGIDGPCGVGALFDPLAAEGRIPGTEIALAGPLGFNLRPWLVRVGHEGFERGWLAAYALEGGEAEALVARYATPEAVTRAVVTLTEDQSPAFTTAAIDRRAVVVHAEDVSETERNDLARRLSRVGAGSKPARPPATCP
jgi:hypothetical protein